MAGRRDEDDSGVCGRGGPEALEAMQRLTGGAAGANRNGYASWGVATKQRSTKEAASKVKEASLSMMLLVSSVAWGPRSARARALDD